MSVIKTKTIELPTFEQLTDDEKETVIRTYFDINVDFSWWDSTYEDAKTIGLKITSFECERNIEGDFISCPEVVAQEIRKNHGEKCDTYILATAYLKERDTISAKETDDNFSEIEEKLEEQSNEFKYNLLQEYLSMLNRESIYLTSDDAIKETLIANDYTFNRETLEIDS